MRGSGIRTQSPGDVPLPVGWPLNRPTAGVDGRIPPSQPSKGSPMSGPGSSAPGTASPAKQPVSPARNIIGIIVLIAVVVVGWLEYSAKAGYNAAVTAVNQRLEDEEHGLPTQSEIENQ